METNIKKTGIRYDFFYLLEEAHSNGRNLADKWDESKSFHHFLCEHNLIRAYNNKENKLVHPQLAAELRANGYSIREIAYILGYKHPGSISHLLKK